MEAESDERHRTEAPAHWSPPFRHRTGGLGEHETDLGRPHVCRDVAGGPTVWMTVGGKHFVRLQTLHQLILALGELLVERAKRIAELLYHSIAGPRSVRGLDR